MAELDEPGDEPNFDLIGSFGLDFFSNNVTFVQRRTFVLVFSERVVFDARNDRKLVQTCQSPVILPLRFIQSNKEHLTGFRVVYVIRTEHQGALTIYTIHPGGNFRCKYSVLQLFQTQNGKIRKCISINWKVQKKKKKCID